MTDSDKIKQIAEDTIKEHEMKYGDKLSTMERQIFIAGFMSGFLKTKQLGL